MSSFLNSLNRKSKSVFSDTESSDIPKSRNSMSSIRTNATNTTTSTNLTSPIPTLTRTPLSKAERSSSPAVNIKDPNLSREIENLRMSYRQQNFWKYHIIKISPFEFYMTTNPDKRHRYVRNAPSYFVKLELPNDSKSTDGNSKSKSKLSIGSQSQIDKGFRLAFTQQQVLGINGYDGYYEPFIIEKLPKDKGGHYKIRCQYNEYQKDWNILNNINSNNKSAQKNLNFQFSNTNNDKEKEDYDSTNGLITVDDYKMNDNLHACSIKEKKKSLFLKSKIEGIKLAKPNSVYFLDTSFFKKRKWFDPVVAVFRPCNRKMKNKLTKSILNMNNLNINNSKKMFSVNKLSVDFKNLTNGNGNGNDNNEVADSDDDDDDNDDDDDDDDINENSENVIDSSSPSSSSVTYSKFCTAKDGFFNRHPKDDSPNDYKIGWLTIFEKGKYFEKIPNAGNWQMVLGMTFAVSFEKMIDKYLKDNNEVL